MKKRVFAALMAGVMGTMMFGITLVSAEAETPELKGEVYAFIAASLNNAMEELQKNFNETYPDVEIFTMQTAQAHCRLRLRKAHAAISSSPQHRSR